jgi:hypothetical protein
VRDDFVILGGSAAKKFELKFGFNYYVMSSRAALIRAAAALHHHHALTPSHPDSLCRMGDRWLFSGPERKEPIIS